MDLWAWCSRVRDSKRWLVALMLANLAGIVFGYYYYWDVGQFNPASSYYESPWLWVFVSDSPNAVVLMSVALIGWHFGLRSKVLDGLAFVHMVYVGLWTTYLFVLYPDQLGTYDWASVADGNANPVLFISHMGMPLEALLLVPHLRDGARPSWWALPAMTAWGALNLVLDYWTLELRPAPFVAAGPELAWGSVGLMLIAVGAWFTIRSLARTQPLPRPAPG